MKTLHRVRERFFWGKVRADVKQWCKSCDACSARKGPKIRSRGKLHRYNVGAPCSNVSLSISCSSAKDCVWKPHRSGGCSAALDIEIWGTSSTSFRSGRNFVSVVLKGVCELFGIDKTKTTPLHPQSDGMVERFNRTILNNLSLMVSKNQQDWDQKVPLSASVPQRRSRDYRIFTIPDAFWPRSSSPFVTCCLVALRIHLHRLRKRIRYVVSLKLTNPKVHNMLSDKKKMDTFKKEMEHALFLLFKGRLEVIENITVLEVW
ncbi:retrovirus-related Pol polyprotein from transposon 412 [Trichonephila clavipes]|nr:retrovirus-related Pol polyprotein from transposon 412 [Trichonephila clavipes]